MQYRQYEKSDIIYNKYNIKINDMNICHITLYNYIKGIIKIIFL